MILAIDAGLTKEFSTKITDLANDITKQNPKVLSHVMTAEQLAEIEEQKKQFENKLFRYIDHINEVANGKSELSKEVYKHHEDLSKDPEYRQRLDKKEEELKNERKELHANDNRNKQQHERLKVVEKEHEHVQNAQVLHNVVTELHDKDMKIEDKAAEAKKRLMEAKAARESKDNKISMKNNEIDKGRVKSTDGKDKYNEILKSNPDVAKQYR